MSATTPTISTRRLADARVPLSDRIGEPSFAAVCAIASVIAVGTLIWIAETVFAKSGTAFSAFGLGFVGHTTWDANHNVYGAAALLYGTFVSSVLALIIATPTAIFIAIYLTELAPPLIRRPVAMLVELLAAIPSVILGLWGIIILGPFLSNHLAPFLHSFLSWIPLFSGPITTGYTMLSAVLILTIMVLPIITALTREIFATTAADLK
jgi:phosphate transport system permease protein